MAIMGRDLIEYIATSLVDAPDMVAIQEIQDDRGILIELRVAPDDMGKVIGKGGRIAKAMRTVLSATKEHERYDLEIVD